VTIASVSADALPRPFATRLLIERRRPGGVSRRALAVDAWLKELAPSPGLNAWYDRSAEQWDRFRDRYFRELQMKPREVAVLTAFLEAGPVTLICRDADHPFGVGIALREFLDSLPRPAAEDVR
jgi:uncharacterized protein YeaO (DUF488 family)